MPYLAFNLNDGNEFVFDILEERLSIGREASNDIVIDNTFISSFHAEFIRQPDGGYEIVDLKSSNGTFVNGRRVERFRVKGGDRIMFGQLESRFRERAPKGLASDGGSKSVATPRGQPSREDGKKGDTESIPARDKGDPPKSTPETGKIEVTKPVVQRAPADLPRPPGGSTPPASLIPKPSAVSGPAPDPAAAKQVTELRSLETTLDLRRKELTQTQSEIAGFKSELEKLRGQVQSARAEVENAKADAGKLDAKRRELGNLESKLDSTRTLVTKAEEDLSTAQKSLQALHEEADKENKVREAAIARLAAEESAAQAKVASVNQILATAQRSEADLKSQRSAELQSLENETEVKRSVLEQILASLAKATDQARIQEAGAAKAAAELAAANGKLGPLQDQIASAEARLKEISLLKNESLKSEAELKSKRSSELQALDVQLAAKTTELAKSQAELNEVLRNLAAQQSALGKTTEEAKFHESTLARLTSDEAEAERNLAALMQQAAAAKTELERLTALQADAQKSAADRRARGSAELQHPDSQLEARRTDLTKAQSELAKVQSDLTSQGEALQKSTAEASTREATLARMIEDEAGAAQRLAGLQKQISEADAELKRLTELRADAQKSEAEQRTKRSADLQEIDKQLDERRADLAKLDTQREAKQSEIEAVNASLKKAQEQVQHAQTQIAQLGGEERAIAARVSELQGNEERLSALTQTLGEMENQRGLLDAAIGALLGRQQSHEAESSAGEHRMKELRVQLADLQQQHLSAEQHLLMLNAKKAESEAAFALQEKESLAKLADIDRQASDTRKLDEAERLEAEKRQADLDAQIAASGRQLAEVQAQVKELEDKAADLTNKLDDLASTDSRLKDSTDALKAVESHKAEVLAAVAALVKDRDERTRELLSATERGRAQSLLTQTLTQRRETLEKEVLIIEEQQAELSQAMGRLREQVRVAETELKDRESKVVFAEQRTKNLEELAATADQQFRILQNEHKKVAEELALAKSELELAVAAVVEKKKEAATAAASAEKSSQQQLTLVEKISGLEAVIATLTTTHATTQQKLSAAESDHQNLQDRLVDRQKEIASAEARVAELSLQTAGLDDRLKELAAANKQNAELSAAITAATQERDKLLSETQRLAKERAELTGCNQARSTGGEAHDHAVTGLVDQDANAQKRKQRLVEPDQQGKRHGKLDIPG